MSALPIPGRGWLASPLALWMESRSTPIADAVEPGAQTGRQVEKSPVYADVQTAQASTGTAASVESAYGRWMPTISVSTHIHCLDTPQRVQALGRCRFVGSESTRPAYRSHRPPPPSSRRAGAAHDLADSASHQADNQAQHYSQLSAQKDPPTLSIGSVASRGGHRF